MERATCDVNQEACNRCIDGPTSKPFVGAITENTFVKADAAHAPTSSQSELSRAVFAQPPTGRLNFPHPC